MQEVVPIPRESGSLACPPKSRSDGGGSTPQAWIGEEKIVLCTLQLVLGVKFSAFHSKLFVPHLRSCPLYLNLCYKHFAPTERLG
jgi:hypothetical protein